MMGCPVFDTLIGAFQHGGQPDLQSLVGMTWRQQLGRNHCAQGEAVCVPGKTACWRNLWGEFGAFALGAEGVDRPLAGRREVVFVIGGLTGQGKEDFAAAVLPQLVGSARPLWGGQQQLRWFSSFDAEFKHYAVILLAPHAHQHTVRTGQ